MLIEYDLALKGKVKITESASKNDAENVPASTPPSADTAARLPTHREGTGEDVKPGPGAGDLGSGLSISFAITCPRSCCGQPDVQSPRQDRSGTGASTKPT